MDFDDETWWLVRHQLGLLSRRQAIAAGYPLDEMRRDARRWRPVLPGVWLVQPGELSPERREVAGLLYAGPGARLAGLSAARRLGVTAADPADTVRIEVPAPRRGRDLGWLSIRRSYADDDGILRGPWLISAPARAVLEAAAAIGIEAVQRRIVTVDELVVTLAQRNRRNSALARQAVQSAATGAWSRPEAHLLTALAKSPILPPVWPNPSLRYQGKALVSPDAWLDEVGMAIMVHSRRFHSGDPIALGGSGRSADWDDTVERDAELTELGVIVVAVTPARIYRDVTEVVRRVERTYESARRRPRPPVHATRRSILSPRRPN